MEKKERFEKETEQVVEPGFELAWQEKEAEPEDEKKPARGKK